MKPRTAGARHRAAARRPKVVTSIRTREAPFSSSEGFIEGCWKDRQTITPDWTPLNETIAGVRVKEIQNVPRGKGFLTEVFRRDWFPDDSLVDQVFQVLLSAEEVSAWHVHRRTQDRLFVLSGLVKIVLYDARADSATFGRVNEWRFGTVRPAVVTVPPGVWHGIENLSDQPSSVLNLVDQAYDYEAPDHWRLPPDTEQIPYRFRGAGEH